MTRIDGDTTTEADPALQKTEEDIERSRERFVASLGALREEITTLTDWREWVRRRPEPFIAGAFALGFWMGWRAAGHRS
jgi:hypothetical protein